MAVRHTRLLRGRVQAEVGLGSAIGGQWIGVTVELDLTNPAVKKAVDALHKVIEQQAMDKVAEAMADRERWAAAVTEGTAKQVRKAGARK